MRTCLPQLAEQYFQQLPSGHVIFYPVAWWCFGFVITSPDVHHELKDLTTKHLARLLLVLLATCTLVPLLTWRLLGIMTFPLVFTFVNYVTLPYGFWFWEDLHPVLSGCPIAVVPTDLPCLGRRTQPENDVTLTGLAMCLVFSLLNVKFAMLSHVLHLPNNLAYSQGVLITGANILLLCVWTFRMQYMCVVSKTVVRVDELGSGNRKGCMGADEFAGIYSPV